MFVSATLALLVAAASIEGPPGPEIHHIALRSGVTLRYAEQGPRWGRPVVLLHGYTDSWQSWELLLPHLPADVRAIAVDLRGHGGSDRPARGYRIRDMADDVAGLLEALNLRAVTLVGHSMGSFVAREVAYRAGDRVAGLVVLGSGPRLANDVVEGVVADVRAMRDSVPLEYIRAFQYGTVNGPVDVGFMRRAIAMSRSVPLATWLAVGEGMLRHDDRGEIERLRIPVLVIGGAEDAVFSDGEQRALFARVRDGQLSSYPGIGHAPHWEAPDQVAADLQRFMTRYAATPQAEER